MDYLARRVETRLDPRELLPGARSAICVALRYWPLGADRDDQADTGDLWPRVARYARGEDYHDVMSERLEHLEDEITALFPGTRTGAMSIPARFSNEISPPRPVWGRSERTATCSIRKWAPTFCWARLLTTLDLEGDTPIADLCGTCSSLSRRLPNRGADRSLPPRQPAVHQLLDHRASGRDSRGRAAEMEDWVFGCDVCQEVCPVNSALPAAEHPEFELRGRADATSR